MRIIFLTWNPGIRSLYAKIRIKTLAEFLGGFFSEFNRSRFTNCHNPYKNLRLPESGLVHNSVTTGSHCLYMYEQPVNRLTIH